VEEEKGKIRKVKKGGERRVKCMEKGKNTGYRAGVYILENTPSPSPGGWKNIGRCHLGEKI
jgi:hypothetical protein